MPSKPTVASRLKDAREATGDTQKQFAVRLNVSYATYLKWEHGDRIPRGLALEALNAKLDAILGK